MLPVKHEPKYQVSYAPNLFDKEAYVCEVDTSVSLQQLFGNPSSYESFYVEVDGTQVELIPADSLYLSEGQLVTITHIPQDKATLRTVLTIVAIVVITYFAGPAGLGLQVGTWQYAAFVGVASIAATLAINTLIPFDKIEAGDRSGKRLDLIGATRNQLLPYEPLRQIFGRIRQYPAYAALPFTEFVGNDQYLHSLFVVGYGEMCAPEKIYIGETDLTSYEGVSIKYVKAADVDYPLIIEEQMSVPFNQPTPIGDIVIRTTAPNAKYIGIDFVFPSGLCWLNDQGDRYTVSVDIKVEVRLVGTIEWKWIKATENSINKWEDLTWGENRIQYYSFYDVMTVNDNALFNSITPSWDTFTTTTVIIDGVERTKKVPLWTNYFRISGFGFDSLRRGLKFAPPDGIGQYEVRITRQKTSRPSYTPGYSNSKDNTSDWDNQWAKDCFISAIRTFKQDTSVVPKNVTSGDNDILYAQIRIKASDQLTGALDLFNHVIQRRYRYWNGSNWVLDAAESNQQVYPRSPAWAAVEVLTGAMNPRPVALDKIDTASFKAWANWCKANEFYYDEEIADEQSVWEVLKGIAASGRAEIVVRDGLYAVVQDNAQSTAVQMFTPRNSKGFRGTKAFLEKIHGVKVAYRSESEGYNLIEQIVYADNYNVSNATKFERIELSGVTSDRQAWREGRRFMGIAVHRPEMFEITTDVEHIACTRGDTVLLQHEAALVGQETYRSIGFGVYDANRSVVVIDGDPVLEVGKSYSIQVRYRSGNSILIATFGVESKLSTGILVLSSRVSDAIAAEGQGALISFGETNLVTIRCKVLSILPKQDLSASLTLIPEGAPLYSADTGSIPPYNPVITQPPDFSRVVPDKPIIIAITSRNWSSPPQQDGSVFQRLMITYLVNRLQNFSGIEVQGRIRESTLYEEFDLVVADWRTTEWMAHDGGSMWFDHIQPDVAYDVQIRVRSLPNLLVSEWSDVNVHIVGKIDHVPPTITDLDIESMLNGVRVLIDTTDVAMRDAAYVEVVYATVNNREDPSAVKYTYNVPSIITPIDMIVFPLPLPDGQQYYFWARIVNRFNIAGGWFPQDSSLNPDVRTTSTGDVRVTSAGDRRVTDTGETVQNGVVGFALQDLVWYILPTRGTAIKNGAGTLRIEAHKFSTDGDVLLSAGTIRMYKPDGTTLAGTGYIWDNIGAADISGSLVITLKDSVSGKVYDTVTLSDITDGVNTPELPLAYMDGYSKMLWRRDRDSGAWQPDTNPIHVDVTFIQGTTVVAKDAMDLSINTTTGAITVSAGTHTAGDLNAGSITWKINGATRTLPYADGTSVLLSASYTINGQVITTQETFYSVEGGSAGTAGPPGASGSLTVSMKANYVTFASTRNNNVYVHGFDGTGTAADVNGTMVHNGAQVTISKGTLLAYQESLRDGWIIFDTASNNVFTGNGSNLYGGVANYNLALVKRFRDGWKYDKQGSGWTAFTFTNSMVIFGSYSKSGAGDSTGSITSVVTFGNGVSPASVPVEQAEIVKPGDIALGAIDNVAQFASTLSPIGIVANIASVTGGTWTGPQVVFAADTRKQYRLVSNTPAVWTQKIVAHEDIEANSIRAGQIEAGAIGTDQLAAESVRASKLAVMTQGMALNLNPQLDDLAAWHHSYPATPSNILSTEPSDYMLEPVANNIGLTALRVVSATNEENRFYSRPFSCDVTKTYRVSCWGRRISGDALTYLFVAFLDNTGANILGSGSGATGWLSMGTHFYFGRANQPLSSDWTKYEFTFGVKGQGSWPAVTPRMMQVGAIATYTTGTATVTEWQDFRVEEVLPGILLQDGTITGDKVAANTITADKIKANELTAREVKANSLTADRLQVGGTNLVNNPGFEFGADGWALTAPVAITSDSPASGYQCLYFPVTTYGAAVGSLIPVSPGDVLICSVWRKTTGSPGSQGIVGVQALTAAGGDILFTPVWVCASSPSWAQSLVNVVVPAGAAFVRVVAYAPVSGTGGYYLDDVRIVNATTSALLVNGAVTADKLAAQIILASQIHTADPAALGNRVTLDNSSVPLWIGSGAKNRENALLQFDAAQSELLIRGRLSASSLDPNETNVLPVVTDSGKFAPVVYKVTQGSYTDTGIGTTNVYVQPGVGLTHPSAGSGLIPTRLQIVQQPVRIVFRLGLWNATGGQRTAYVTLQHRYGIGAWTDSVPGGVLISRIVPNNRPAYIEHSIWVNAKADWNPIEAISFRLGVKVDTGGNGFNMTGMAMDAEIYNLGAVNTDVSYELT